MHQFMKQISKLVEVRLFTANLTRLLFKISVTMYLIICLNRRYLSNVLANIWPYLVFRYNIT
jgi:hypothetical protein